MATAARRQDLPPEGGYNAVNYKRVPAKTFFKGRTIILGYLGMTAGAAYLYILNCGVIQKRDIELRSALFAIQPMLQAERDREYLKQLRRNRDEEAKLMANVEGWKVGTWYGEPIFHTRPEDELIEPKVGDFYVHTDMKSFKKRAYLQLWS